MLRNDRLHKWIATAGMDRPVETTMRPLKAFLLSFAAGLMTLASAQYVVSGLLAPEPVPALKGPLVVPVA